MRENCQVHGIHDDAFDHEVFISDGVHDYLFPFILGGDENRSGYASFALLCTDDNQMMASRFQELGDILRRESAYFFFN